MTVVVSFSMNTEEPVGTVAIRSWFSMGNMRQRITLGNSGITTLPHTQLTPVAPILLPLVSMWAKYSHSTTRTAALPILDELLQGTVPCH